MLKKKKSLAVFFLLGIVFCQMLLSNTIIRKKENEETNSLQDVGEGWKQDGEDWYYINSDGKPVVDDWFIWYYFDKDGKLVKNQYRNHFFLDEDGIWGGTYTDADWKADGNWEKDGEDWYFIGKNGEQSQIDFSNMRCIARCGYDYENPDTPPEQSRTSYKMAKEKGFDVLLCDLRFTADEIPVCYHYDTINNVARNLDGSEIEKELSVEELTYEELMQYDWGIYKGNEYKGTKLMSLPEMLSFMEELDSELYVEIKTGNEEQVMSAVEIAKDYNIKISWAGSTMEQCEAVVKADNTARVATMPTNINEKELEKLMKLKTPENEVFFFTYDTAMLSDEMLKLLKEHHIPFEMGTINTG